MYKLVAVDLDGTLLNNEGKLSNYTKDIIFKLKKRGVKIVLVSGRCFKSILKLNKKLKLDTPIIANNGALIRKADGEIISCTAIPEELARKLLTYAHENNIPHIGFYYPDNIYAEKMTEKAREVHVDLEGITPKIVPDLTKTLDKKLVNVVMNVYLPDVKKIKTDLKDRFSSQLSIVQSTATCIDLTLPQATKGNALQELLDYYHLNSEEVIAIGDNDNDVSLLKKAGYGVAMKEAHPALKKVADEIAEDNNKDGAARILKKAILT